MTGDDGAPGAGDPATAIARLQAIRGYVEDDDYGYLDLTGMYGSDPRAENPYVVQGTFIPEEIGGSVTVVAAGDGHDDAFPTRENLNQMLNNFLPGGYKQRWGDFDLWRGAWDHETDPGCADVGPMFEWADSFPLTDLLGDVSEVAYTELSFDPDAVRVYVPRTVRVVEENKADPQYVWIPGKQIVWTGDPPMQTERLSSDPTTNYLWFKHVRGSFDDPSTDLPDCEVVQGASFDDDRDLLRCYYASLLTLYPADSTRTKSGLVEYRCEDDDATAFVASRERSQLVTLTLDRSTVQSRIEDTLDANPRLERDLRVALLRSNVWEQLFFDDRALPHTFAIDPLVEHLLGIDYWQRVQGEEMGVFGLPGDTLVDEGRRLLPDESNRHLRLLGHEDREVSAVFDALEQHQGTMAMLLARSRNQKLLVEFAERVLVHSVEHALSTWANDLTGSGTSFELWYDVNFQASDDPVARVGIYDPIQGGAGIAKEVHDRLQAASDTDLDVEGGLTTQGQCHSATADRTAVELLASYPDGSLYDVYESDRERFDRLVDDALDRTVDDPDAYSSSDLRSNVEQRVRTLFETRELARFYSYVAGEYTTVEDTVGRIPRVVDLALHLDRHVFTDPNIKATYDRFADDSGRRDIAELGERLGELTIQCVTACPDCLKTGSTTCLHGTGRQEATLSRRLLTEVLTR